MIPRLIPDTVEGAVRSLYRTLSHDDRMELAVDISGPLSPKMSRFVRFHRATQQHVIRYCFLEVGNPELLADVSRIKGSELSVADVAVYITNRLTDRARLDRWYYPRNVEEAANVLDAELSVAEHIWLSEECLTEHGLLMYQLVTWCVQRFGLGEINHALITELAALMKREREQYTSRN